MYEYTLLMAIFRLGTLAFVAAYFAKVVDSRVVEKLELLMEVLFKFPSPLARVAALVLFESSFYSRARIYSVYTVSF